MPDIRKENLDLIYEKCGWFSYEIADNLFSETPDVMNLYKFIRLPQNACMVYLLEAMMVAEDPQQFLDIFIKYMKEYCDNLSNKEKAQRIWGELQRSMRTMQSGGVEHFVEELINTGNHEIFTKDKCIECLLMICAKSEEMLFTQFISYLPENDPIFYD